MPADTNWVYRNGEWVRPLISSTPKLNAFLSVQQHEIESLISDAIDAEQMWEKIAVDINADIIQSVVQKIGRKERDNTF